MQLFKCTYCSGRGTWPDDGTEKLTPEVGRISYNNGPYLMKCQLCKGTGWTSNGERTGPKGQSFAPGFGCCQRCKTPWAFVEGHSTPINSHSSMFPMCKACHKEIEPEERLIYYNRLIREWKREFPDSDNGTPWEEVEASVKRSVLKGN